MVIGWILTLIAGVAGVTKWLASASATIASEALALARWTFDKAIDMYRHAYDLAPKAVKFLTLLFFLSVIGGMITFFLQFYFVCDNGDLRQSNSMFGGLTIYINDLGRDIAGINMTESERQELFDDNTFAVKDNEDDTIENMMRVRCIKGDAKLTFLGIDIFDPLLYVLLFLLGFIIWLMLKLR